MAEPSQVLSTDVNHCSDATASCGLQIKHRTEEREPPVYVILCHGLALKRKAETQSLSRV